MSVHEQICFQTLQNGLVPPGRRLTPCFPFPSPGIALYVQATHNHGKATARLLGPAGTVYAPCAHIGSNPGRPCHGWTSTRGRSEQPVRPCVVGLPVLQLHLWRLRDPLQQRGSTRYVSSVSFDQPLLILHSLLIDVRKLKIYSCSLLDPLSTLKLGVLPRALHGTKTTRKLQCSWGIA